MKILENVLFYIFCFFSQIVAIVNELPAIPKVNQSKVNNVSNIELSNDSGASIDQNFGVTTTGGNDNKNDWIQNTNNYENDCFFFFENSSKTEKKKNSLIYPEKGNFVSYYD